ncbi:DUF805 domain-containing protein [Pseudochelatococcus contaminans]|uniref:Uncharacterized membrane protein YhaH (DUF805 family) n=1 Tax=Pseudochelatococcus contaminans TaxID=1538103 RepID=A0A7W5Z5L8_9HYPH|nr:DUF805 domain-containing protein [Pseudochelatococcus contaminans]MBB3810129.1 uncharacterized membrane protein YhaH (DUF805 family) [Pseudochelatococcus contaminans]
MGFTEAIRTVLTKKYATFSGRASRSEYWWFQLFYWLVLVAVSLFAGLLLALFSSDNDELSAVHISIGLPIGIIFLALIVPLIALQVRRFHDRNISGWWYLALAVLSLIPYIGAVVGIAILVISVMRGTDGANKFGPDPLRPEATADVFA